MQERDMTTETITDDVRDRYAAAARAVLDPSLGRSDAATSCCAPDGTAAFGEILYDADQRAGLPEAAVLASLGCGNPTAVAELHDGETVLDLGSGGGIDVLLSAQRVGPNGFVYGLDMTDEMLELARRNAVAAGATNVEFRKGRIESIPLGDGAVDVVISNCVVNLSTDKAAVLAEIARVLRPGGRIGISDVVAEDRLSPAERAERGSFVCGEEWPSRWATTGIGSPAWIDRLALEWRIECKRTSLRSDFLISHLNVALRVRGSMGDPSF
jgi:SAM-dependent methyltransferase